MERLQVSNFIFTQDDDKVRISNTANTWALEVTIANHCYSHLIMCMQDENLHKILESYAMLNYIMSQVVIIEQEFINDFVEAYERFVFRIEAMRPKLEGDDDDYTLEEYNENLEEIMDKIDKESDDAIIQELEDI